MKVALTGGIACGKSLVAKYLDDLGFKTLDADDIVHTLIPDAERARLAKIVFGDPQARAELEARIHPLVKERLMASPETIHVIPLLFETHWDAEYDIICCVKSEKATQVSRMMTMRGYTREEAEARLAAQMPVAEKAEKSHYVISNDGSVEELRTKTEGFVTWLKNTMCSRKR